MKKNCIRFAILVLVLALAVSLFACNASGNNSVGGLDGNKDTGISTVTGDGSSADINDKTDDKEFITDWEDSGIFIENDSEYEFDFTVNDSDFSYKTGSEADEELFKRILSGEENYIKHFDWFAANPDYIYRFNEERYKAAGKIIRAGEFTQQLRDKYFGLFTVDTNYPYFSALGITTEHYQIYFNDDWSIREIKKTVQYNVRYNAYKSWHYELIGYTLGSNPEIVESEVLQYDEFIKPEYNNQQLTGYKVTFASLTITVDMGDGKTADCSVHSVYEPKIKPEWNEQKQKYENVTYLSECTVAADINGVYSGGNKMFDGILILAQRNGEWNLLKVWELYREEVLTPSSDLCGTNGQKVYYLA